MNVHSAPTKALDQLAYRGGNALCCQVSSCKGLERRLVCHRHISCRMVHSGYGILNLVGFLAERRSEYSVPLALFGAATGYPSYQEMTPDHRCRRDVPAEPQPEDQHEYEIIS